MNPVSTSNDSERDISAIRQRSFVCCAKKVMSPFYQPILGRVGIWNLRKCVVAKKDIRSGFA